MENALENLHWLIISRGLLQSSEMLIRILLLWTEVIQEVMGLASFENVMIENIQKQKDKMAAMLSKFSIFDQLTKESKVLVGYYWKTHTYSIGQVVYSEGQPADMIYLIKSGEFELSKVIYVK
jgi:hypothetical protein